MFYQFKLWTFYVEIGLKFIQQLFKSNLRNHYYYYANIIYKNLHNCRKHNLKRLFGSENISYKTQTEFQISFRETFILLAGLIVSISSPHSSLSSKHSTSISWWFCVSDADLVWVLFPMVSSMAAWLCPDMLSGGTLCDIWYWLCLESDMTRDWLVVRMLG